MKLSKLINASSIIQPLISMNFPAKVAYRIAKNARLLEQELTHYNEIRIKLLNTYGIPPEGGNGEYSFEEGKRVEFETAYAELIETEVDIPFLLSSGEELGNTELQPWVFSALEEICFKE